MSMDPYLLDAVVAYVENHLGCSETDIQAAIPNVNALQLHSLLAEASEGGNDVDEGGILLQKDGLYYPGPYVHLGHFKR